MNTTKSTKDTKVFDNYYSKLRALRVLRGEKVFTAILVDLTLNRQYLKRILFEFESTESEFTEAEKHHER